MMPALDRKKIQLQVIDALSKTAAGNAAGIDIEVRLTNRGTGLELDVREWMGCAGDDMQDWKCHVLELPAYDGVLAQRMAVSFASGILAMAAFRKMARMRAHIADKDI